jgi:hypothetical protein
MTCPQTHCEHQCLPSEFHSTNIPSKTVPKLLFVDFRACRLKWQIAAEDKRLSFKKVKPRLLLGRIGTTFVNTFIFLTRGTASRRRPLGESS